MIIHEAEKMNFTTKTYCDLFKEIKKRSKNRPISYERRWLLHGLLIGLMLYIVQIFKGGQQFFSASNTASDLMYFFLFLFSGVWIIIFIGLIGLIAGYIIGLLKK